MTIQAFVFTSLFGTLISILSPSYGHGAQELSCRDLVGSPAFGLLGSSINHGQLHTGTSKAYDHLLRDKKFWKKIAVPYKDFGTLPFKNSSSIYKDLYDKTLEIINQGFRPWGRP